jgi:glyoxylase-like metal-dependent hydrolase (beta-lactamase superfamily II)
MHPDLEIAEASERWPRIVADDLAYLRTAFSNVYFAGPPGARDRDWVLVDAGIPGSAEAIRRAAVTRFGPGSRPSAIVLTHGHFDHVGALRELAEEWDVPIYAHPLEMPYLTGRSAYPPPDPMVGHGAMSRLSFLYPRGPIDVSGRTELLPADGSVPGMEGWRWLHTPGHSPGHVSFFRDADRALIAGDAFVTTRQESLLSVLAQKPEVHGPPMYFTPDWEHAHSSVERLAELDPAVAATGHGHPLRGEEMRRELRAVARDFRRCAMPRHGRYLRRPAIADERGVVSVPPPASPDRATLAAAGVAAALASGAVLGMLSSRRGKGDGRDVRFLPDPTLDASLRSPSLLTTGSRRGYVPLSETSRSSLKSRASSPAR